MEQEQFRLDFGPDFEDVEPEDVRGPEKEGITKPFNPDDIDVDMATVNLGMLIEMLENNEIDLEPDFQRSSDTWDNVKRSRLIESILLGLPLPSFYFSEDPVTRKLSVIDGLQRLTAIKNFVIDKTLRLEGLQFLTDFNDSVYGDMGRPEIRRIKGLKITMNTLYKSTPNDVKYIIFQRVNTAGEPLTEQEMRHALNQGPAADFIKELAGMDSFTTATEHKIPTKRMQDRDFANRFVAFYIGYEEYNGLLDEFLNDKMGALNRMKQEERAGIRTAFDKSMQACREIFGDDAFRKRYDRNDKRKPISKSIFDTVSVNVAWLDDYERDVLVRDADAFRERMVELCNRHDFNQAISTGTGQLRNVRIRFEAVRNLIREIIENAPALTLENME